MKIDVEMGFCPHCRRFTTVRFVSDRDTTARVCQDCNQIQEWVKRPGYFWTFRRERRQLADKE